MSASSPPPSTVDPLRVRCVREHVARALGLLPGQGPLTAFVHHNPLHAFEDRPFHEAVQEAARALGAEPYLTEDAYRHQLSIGRILPEDLDEVLHADLGPRAAEPMGPFGRRFDVCAAIARRGLRAARGPALAWRIAETDAVTQLRDDIGSGRRARMIAWTRGAAPDLSIEALGHMVAQALWSAALDAADRHAPGAPPPSAAPRMRDVLLEASGRDTDAYVHALLFRCCAAFLDQGTAAWTLPYREQGFYRAVLAVYRDAAAGPGRWATALPRVLAEEAESGRDAWASIAHSLDLLGETPTSEGACLQATLLAAKGFAGMMRQMELRPDRAPTPVPASIQDFLAVRLLFDRVAAGYVAGRHLRYDGDLVSLRALLVRAAPPPPAASRTERAFVLFQLAQLTGTDPDHVRAMTATEVAAILAEVESFRDVALRRVLHEAYERRHEVDTLDALSVHAPTGFAGPPTPAFQAVFCLDDREESIRRHLEEIEPDCETLGAAGHFGIAMAYRGVGEAHFIPLAPVAIQPQHEIVEVVREGLAHTARRRARSRRTLGRMKHRLGVGSRGPVLGAIVTSVLGAFAAIPAVCRVLLPRWTENLRRRAAGWVEPPHATRLVFERQGDERTATGRFAGFTPSEMAPIVRSVLTAAGFSERLAPLVLIVGHGSTSLNNPHEAAHDCGACGGGRGGPNARLFALMANHPGVRQLLAEAGLVIPAGTWFVGALHDTCSDDLVLHDLDAVPPGHAAILASASTAVAAACARSAKERCRRFRSVPVDVQPERALRRVAARTADLAQTRPEYGHATNAVCVIGRRTLTRGLFMDRRAFLASYDPSTDDADDSVLGAVLPAVLGVCAGINLEYYFSRVDPAAYGCRTKLPHNVTSLLGVMDGHRSDLRTGLPWQMVEIHEPVRMLTIVDACAETVQRVLARHPETRRLVEGGWVRCACRDPETGVIALLRGGTVSVHVPRRIALPSAATSAAWYGGHRDHLGYAQIGAGAAEPA